MTISYTDAIGQGYPNVRVHSLGDGMNYDLLSWTGGDSLPSKAELDSWIANEYKNIMWRKIQAERERRKFNGVKVGTNWFHTDDSSRIQQLGLVLMGAGMPAGIMWKTLGGSFVQMTPTLAGQIFQAIGGQDMAIFGKAEQHKAAMLAAPNPSAYDFLTGWPVTFGE